MGAITFIVLALGATRLTLIITRDTITEPIRHAIFMYFPPPDNKRHGWEYQQFVRIPKDQQKELAETGGLGFFDKRFVWYDVDEPLRDESFFGTLLSCPDCVGVWVALVTAIAWWVDPVVAFNVALPLAIATVVSFVARRGGFS